MQDVVAAAEGAGALDGQHVERLLDDAQQPGVAGVVVADDAGVILGDVETDRAELGVLLQVLQGRGQVEGLVVGGAQQVEGQARGRLGADAGQAGEFIDEPLDGARQHGVGHGD